MSSEMEATREKLRELVEEIEDTTSEAKLLLVALKRKECTALDLEELTRKLELHARRAALVEVYYLREISYKEAKA